MPAAVATDWSDTPELTDTLSNVTAGSSSTVSHPNTALLRATIAIATIFGT